MSQMENINAITLSPKWTRFFDSLTLGGSIRFYKKSTVCFEINLNCSLFIFQII